MALDTVYSTTLEQDPYERLAESEISKSMASRNHAKIQSRMAKILGNQYDENYDVLTEFEVELVSKRVVPDVCICPLEPSNWQNDVIRGSELPLLLVEILSPRQAFDDIMEKIRDIYFPAGAKSVWVVLPSAESIMVFKPHSKPATFSQGILKDATSGFDIDLDKVFI
jgi:Uma2 family endonuclease